MDTLTDPRAAGAHVLIEGEYLIFGRFADPMDDILDHDVDEVITETMVLTRRGRTFVENGIFGYARLRDLPRLRALHAETRLLDVPRLAAIDRTLCVLPAGCPDETWAIFDDALVDMFTLTRPGQAMPSIWLITRRLRRLIASIDTAVNFDPVTRKRRTAPAAPGASIHPVDINGTRYSELTLTTNNATMACIRARLTEVARRHHLSLGDAIITLLAGDISTSVRPVLHLFRPTPADAHIAIPGFGSASADDMDTLHRLFDATPPREIDLDAVRTQRVERYRPTPEMTTYVQARDGTCIYPGCHRPAPACQLDHRIPYDEGGPTTPTNLFALCQHHHNVKTDKRAFYVPDPSTGEIVWLFANGTWATSESNGILAEHTTPDNPRWARTVGDSRRARNRVARFNAACHTLCDTYDRDGDLDACLTGIRDLERTYGLTFEFAPDPEESPRAGRLRAA